MLLVVSLGRESSRINVLYDRFQLIHTGL